MYERLEYPTIATEVELEAWGSADLLIVNGDSLDIGNKYKEHLDRISANFAIETGGGILKGDNLWFCMDGDIPVAVIGASDSKDGNALVIQSIYVQGAEDEESNDYRQCHIATKLIDTVIEHAIASEINNYKRVDVSDALWKTEIVLARMLPRLEREGKVSEYSSYRPDELVGGSYHCLTLNK